ncbi:hypothetical protein D3C71_1893540 [compost metagenome]
MATNRIFCQLKVANLVFDGAQRVVFAEALQAVRLELYFNIIAAIGRRSEVLFRGKVTYSCSGVGGGAGRWYFYIENRNFFGDVLFGCAILVGDDYLAMVLILGLVFHLGERAPRSVYSFLHLAP